MDALSRTGGLVVGTEIMIRTMTSQDIERVGEIWLAASILAHDFVPADFWRANLSTMTQKLLPQSESYVWVTMERLDGFITLGYDVVHCLFVEPSRQHRGVGSSLLSHVKRSREKLCLKVYQENTGAKAFYEAHGFAISGEASCPYTGYAEFEMEWEKTPEAPHA